MSGTPSPAPADGTEGYYRRTGDFEYHHGYWYGLPNGLVKMAAWQDPIAPGTVVDPSEIDWKGAEVATP